MKSYSPAILTFSALLVILIPFPVKALPFHKNCASMQSYFNSSRWNNTTKFLGFENQKVLIINNANITTGTHEGAGISFLSCSGGYIRETSPMGTRVCQGSITYRPAFTQYKVGPGFEKPKLSWDSESIVGGSCRWK